jgi:hypothetical protein
MKKHMKKIRKKVINVSGCFHCFPSLIAGYALYSDSARISPEKDA